MFGRDVKASIAEISRVMVPRLDNDKKGHMGNIDHMMHRHGFDDDEGIRTEGSPLMGGSGEADDSHPKHADNSLAIPRNGRVRLTEEDSRRICRKTDRAILTILVWVYFLQILDKTVLGFGATYGLKEDTNLTPGQYSLIGSIGPFAQLVWQPFSSILIVKVPHRILMPTLCLGWGLAQTAMAACHTFEGLMVTRFFLGLFEAGCLPLFSVITSQWYRRAEQPIRVAAWYSTNGAATIVAAGISYILGRIESKILKEWQIIFLSVGLLTIASAPFVYWNLDNDIQSARFLTEKEKIQAKERLRANQTGTGSRDFKSKQITEAVFEFKTYLWIAMAMLLNIGASVTNIFGPLIISGLGFDKYATSLLNMPFGAFQLVLILFASFLAQKAKLKSVILAVFMLPVVAGLIILYSAPRQNASQAPLLFGFYLLAFIFGGNPLIVTWIVGNTAGTTKKSAIMSVYNAASSTGNIIGPLLFNDSDAPSFKPGLRACLVIFLALIVVVLIQWGNLVILNKMQEKRRVQNGKKAKVIDRSMQEHYENIYERDDDIEDTAHGELDDESDEDIADRLGQKAFLDMTDRENDEFVYVY
ncbi:putative transporter [Cladobotryum mycophilum]|uniref:Transporter n=1 Tax=Cladobotryum mycophilum TaxID=491253 RepID=A0ABR0SNP3_9HYPO